MKKHPPVNQAQKAYRAKLRWRKFALYAVLFVAFVVVLVQSTVIFIRSNVNRLVPQIERAVIQVAKLLPQLEQNEASLRDAYDQMQQSWDTVLSSGDFSKDGYTIGQSELDKIVRNTLAWTNRVTKLKVGREGFMVVVSKETSRILAHPDERYIGRQYLPFDEIKQNVIIPIRSIHAWTNPEDLDVHLALIEPYKYAKHRYKSLAGYYEYYSRMLVGSVIDYDDTYIVCGVPMLEVFSYIYGNAMIFWLFFLILMWLLVKWICLVLSARRESVKSMRTKLISYSVIVCIALFSISWYSQILSDVTNDLKTMERHADVAVETLNTYQEQRQNLNDWLDEFYGTQCWLASELVTLEGRDNLTRADVQRFADELCVKYIYVFDEQGEVVVTNSPYDHYRLGRTPEDVTYPFRAMLDGVAGLTLDPVYDEQCAEALQYHAISVRSADDLCDGFVMIAVEPTLREDLLAPLTVDTVLSNLIIGLPEYAIAIDKDTLSIVSTTGIGFKDASIESLGLTEDNLTEDFSGFLKINGTLYYAGVSESSDMFLVPIVRRSGKLDSFVISLKLTAYALVTALLITLLTLFRYQRDVLDAAPPEPDKAMTSEETDEALAAEGVPQGLFARVSNFLRVQEKQGLQDRWHTKHIPKNRQTPEQRIIRTIYWMLMWFCLFILLPTLYVSLNRGASSVSLNNLAYVISGNWQKGLNIFALTSCIFLLCAMYVGVVLVNRILYLIARVSNMRVETVCLLLKNSVKYICVVVFVYYGLAQFGVETQTLLASAGILSLMISFGAKDMVSDIIAGFFTLFEGTYKVGDFITVGSWYGTVAEIGLRTTKVRFFSETKIFNNSSMRDIINADGPVSRMILKMPISYNADLESVEAILDEELPKLTDVIPGLVKPPKYEGVDAFESSSVTLRIAIYVDTGVRYPALRTLNREVKLIFDRHGIEIPFNQIVVHRAEDAAKLAGGDGGE